MSLSTWVKHIAKDNRDADARDLDDRATGFPRLSGPDDRLATTARDADVFVSFIDRIGTNSIEGWAYYTDDPDAAVIVEAVTDTGKRTLAIADMYREDVADAGHGTGRYGFFIDLAPLRLENESVIVRCAESQRPISRAPIAFDPQSALVAQTLPSAFSDAMRLMAARVRQAHDSKSVVDTSFS